MVQVTAAQATSDDQEPEQRRDRRARRASELRTEETALERAETSHLFRLRRTVRGPHHALVVCAAGASLSTLWRRHLRPSAALARRPLDHGASVPAGQHLLPPNAAERQRAGRGQSREGAVCQRVQLLHQALDAGAAGELQACSHRVPGALWESGGHPLECLPRHEDERLKTRRARRKGCGSQLMPVWRSTWVDFSASVDT
mmetsp:Transcript_17347/g.66092  ORF Transcript_17347/g.66092 Transcript_17347/m.66092 type:complete len:201 (+) Transcript_17347:69-671(+)